MSAATMTVETSFEVLDENNEVEQVTHVKPRKREAASPKTDDAAASELAEVMRDAAQAAAKASLEINLTAIAAEKAGIVSGMKSEAEKLVEYIEKQSKLYAKPQNLCLHVKLNDAPVKKLTTRISPLLKPVLAQATIGQRGMKWPLVIGPTGSGKTVLAHQLSETLSVPFFAINGAEGVGESALYGRWTKEGFVHGPVRKAAQTGGVCLLDEYDAFNDNVLLCLNTWLASKVGTMLTCPMSGETFPMHKDCYFIAAANSNGKGGDGVYSGRNRLDGASLNRFSLFQLSYDAALERELCPDTVLLEKLWSIRVKLSEKNAKDVISTRDIVNAYAQQGAGFSLAEIMECLKLRMDKANQELFTVKGGK